MNDGYDNELKGVLYRNTRMREGKQDPNFTGNATIKGEEYWLSAWMNTSKKGEKYMAINFRPKDVQAPAQPSVLVKVPDDDFFDDEIPFGNASNG